MAKLSHYLLCAAAVTLLFSCSDKEPEVAPISVNPTGSVIVTDQGTVSCFYVANRSGLNFDKATGVEFRLVNPGTQTELTFDGTVESVRNQIVDGLSDALSCRMVLGDSNIDNGFYYLSIFADGEAKCENVYVSVTDNSITAVKGAQYSYSRLEGDGTSQTPYLIKSSDDFEYFLTSLAADPEHGYGRYFTLQADVQMKSYSDNPVLARAEFQGTLNGGGLAVKELKLDGQRLPSAHAGLFSSIFNATVADLVISDVVMTEIDSYCGAIAGYAKGINTLRGIKVTGQTGGRQYIGGLIGAAEGTLQVRDCQLDINVLGGSFSGGVAGRLTSTSASSEISNITLDGQVMGDAHAGGLIGFLDGTGSPKIGAIDNRMYVHGAENVGGFFGSIIRNAPVLTGDCRFNGARTQIAPGGETYSVYGNQNVGGFAGYVDLGGTQNLDFKQHGLYIEASVHAVKANAGGCLGYVAEGRIHVDHLDLTASDNAVSSEGECVGGLAGRLDGAELIGPLRINIDKALPQPGSITPICSATVKGKTRVGGCVGYAIQTEWGDPVLSRGKVVGLATNAKVSASGDVVGGVIGEIYGDVQHCAFMGNVSGPKIVGGVIGKSEIEVDQMYCVNYSDIEGGEYQGGISGYSNPAKTPTGYDGIVVHTDCYNIGRLTNGKTAGGITGYAGQKNGGCEFQLYGCENYGEIRAAGDGNHSVGGIVGDADNDKCKIEWCYNYAPVSSKNVQFVIGGVAGKCGREQIASNYVHIVGCLNMGKVSCDASSTKLGGVIGHLMYGTEARITGCVNWGDIAVDQKSDTGGILGCATSFNYIARCWNRGKISHGNGIVGTHKTATAFDHYGNYYLAGSGGSWPSAIEVKASDLTNKKAFPDLPFYDHPDYYNWMGEHFYMSSEGPIPFRFDFLHWDADRLRPAGWKIQK